MYEQCRFCGLEHNEKQRVLSIHEYCIVIFSNPRLMPGHLLVIPKRHVLSLSELDDAEQKELFDVTIAYQGKILKNIASGCDIKQHNRPFLPENDLKVDHVHIHLQPRDFEDELYLKAHIHDREIFKPLLEAEREKLQALLKM
jgi:histidine triad (HIT) family protein